MAHIDLTNGYPYLKDGSLNKDYVKNVQKKYEGYSII